VLPFANPIAPVAVFFTPYVVLPYTFTLHLTDMKKILIPILFVVFTICTQAQVAVNITGNNPASSAMLDVSSTNKGMLMPRMTSAQRKAILSPEKGLLVFDTDRETIYFFNGIKWKPMMTATESTAPMISRTPEGGKSHSEFGASVDIYDNYVVVGAPSDSAQGVTGGAVYVFVKENGIWKQQAKLSAPTPAVADAFGKAVSIYGNLLLEPRTEI
jgi:hypothetical protein